LKLDGPLLGHVLPLETFVAANLHIVHVLHLRGIQKIDAQFGQLDWQILAWFQVDGDQN
jgi:hypothetical protein